jgi:hypothetical protein
MRLAAILLLVVGCGSSSKSSTSGTTTVQETPEDPKERAEREAREKREAEIDAMMPKEPYEPRDKLGFQPTERCGQGPYRFEVDMLAAHYGESVDVYACGKHAVAGNYRMTQKRKNLKKEETWERQFGYEVDNKACKGTPVAVVEGGGGGGGAAKGGGSSAAKGGATAAAPEKIAPTTLTKTTAISTDCVRTHIIGYGWVSWDDRPAFDGKLVFDIWSEEPNDMEGLVFVVERRTAVPDMTVERWRKYQADYAAWFKIYREFRDGEKVAGRLVTVDRTVKTPPPPAARAETPPPRPSKNARWIPGYWLYEESKFHWITGLWDVPEEDIKKELTVVAPTPPPAEPVKVEVPVEPAPTRTAVWTPGSWYWDGGKYVWIAGAWRIPPSPQQTWQRPTWTVKTGRAIYVPGGWRIRIGR